MGYLHVTAFSPVANHAVGDYDRLEVVQVVVRNAECFEIVAVEVVGDLE